MSRPQVGDAMSVIVVFQKGSLQERVLCLVSRKSSFIYMGASMMLCKVFIHGKAMDGA